jgi:hypothetical protein
MTKKGFTYFRALDWEGLKRWVKYGNDSDTHWRDLATVLVERAEEDRDRADEGYHHWDSN